MKWVARSLVRSLATKYEEKQKKKGRDQNGPAAAAPSAWFLPVSDGSCSRAAGGNEMSPLINSEIGARNLATLASLAGAVLDTDYDFA